MDNNSVLPEGFLEFGPYGLTEDMESVDLGCILFRKVFNDVRVSDWRPIIDFSGRTYQQLKDYLTVTYHGADPELKVARLFGIKSWILEDKNSYQYWGVEAIPEDVRN